MEEIDIVKQMEEQAQKDSAQLQEFEKENSPIEVEIEVPIDKVEVVEEPVIEVEEEVKDSPVLTYFKAIMNEESDYIETCFYEKKLIEIGKELGLDFTLKGTKKEKIELIIKKIKEDAAIK